MNCFDMFRVVLKHVSETLNLHESATRELDSNKKAEGVEHSYCCHQFMNNIWSKYAVHELSQILIVLTSNMSFTSPLKYTA